jgi:hypothetical protein
MEKASADFLRQMKETHTSYLRLNYYPPCRSGDGNGAYDDEDTDDGVEEDKEVDEEGRPTARPRPLGVRRASIALSPFGLSGSFLVSHFARTILCSH